MNDWWQENNDTDGNHGNNSDHIASATRTSSRPGQTAGSAPRLGALGANTIVVGLAAGLLAPIVGLSIAAVFNGQLLEQARELHLGTRTVAVAFLLGAVLAGWGPLTGGQTRFGLRRGAVAGVGTAVVAAMMLPLVDGLWRASRADDQPGSMLVLVGAWVVIGGLTGAVAGIEDGTTRAINGLVGGLSGGLLGGLCFAALSGDFRVTEESSFLSQLAGYTATAIGIGLGVGLTERLTRSAWLVAIDGPQAGREFILYHQRSAVGIADDCEVYLGPDPAVAARHAELTRTDDRIEVWPVDGAVSVDRRPFDGGPVENGSVLHIGGSYLRVELR